MLLDDDSVAEVHVLGRRTLATQHPKLRFRIVDFRHHCHGPRYPSGSVLSMWLKVSQAQSCLLAAAELVEADVVIAPSIAPAGIDDAQGRENARRLGYEAARAAIPILRACLNRLVRPDASTQEHRRIHVMRWLELWTEGAR
ncbi:hypothetical protein [Variovorax atrisoli]|uniref:hypothetical protein n=1 Tax=Variovorax atrisoli TaxID=3394203 RepID=UPI0003820D93|nr:hypothetical protein [Variovorax paradoxus]